MTSTRPGITAIHTTWGRFATTVEVTVIRYAGAGLWTVRTSNGTEFNASESELTMSETRGGR